VRLPRVLHFLLPLLLFVSSMARADIILLLSDDKAPVVGVARAIQSSYQGRIDVHNLNGSRAQEVEIVQAIRDSQKRQVVAVGLLAAQVARQKLASKQVVFCQVLNVEEFDLVTPWMKGVSGIPSLSRQFAAWKLLDPGLRKVGIITGRNARYMVEEAEAAAKHNGLELEHIEVTSDRAVLFAAQDLRDRKIQGLWLAPDSSILSQRAILDLMSFSVKNHLQVLAFSPALLKEGALLSATSDVEEIARLVLDRVRKASGTQAVPGEGVASLGTAKIVVSGATATRFGLAVSTKLREQADVQ
jgi:ABC-type uncharacterized transport system substrate-binding protein